MMIRCSTSYRQTIGDSWSERQNTNKEINSMKINSILFAGCAVVLAALSSCADDDFVTTIANLEDYAPQKDYSKFNLGSYNPLKTYVNYSANPDFKLGIAVTASQYAEKTGVFLLANDNFDEVVAGNAMKMDQCVSSKDGSMDFGKVVTFIDAAEYAGLSVYGHTLAWHSQQPKKWLTSLIASKGGSGTAVKQDPMLFEVDFNKDETLAGNGVSFYQYVNEGPDGSRCFKLDCPSVGATNDWDAQIQIGADFEAGVKYAVEFDVKGTESGDRGMSHEGVEPANYGAGGYSVSTDWQHVTILYTTGAAGGRFHFNLGKFPGTIWIDNFKIYNKDLYDQQQPVEVEDVLYSFDDDVNFVGNGESFFQIAAEGPNGSKCFKLDCPSVGAKDAWDAQLQVGYEFVEGTEYIVSMKVKGTADASLGMSHEGIANPNWGAANFNVTTEWSNVRYTYKPAAEGGKFQFNLGKYEGTIWIDDFKISHMEEPIISTPGEEVVIVNEAVLYTFDDDVNFVGNGASFFQIAAEGPEGSKCFKLDCPSVGAKDAWDAQLQVGYEFVAGTAYKVSMKIKGTEATSLGMSHEGIASPNWGAANFNVTTEWSDVEYSYTPTADGGKFQFNLGAYPGTLWIDDFKITFESKEIIGGTELSPEEKKEILADAMSKWIKGMMEACDGRVKAWDVVNEAISGADTDGDGKYDLQHEATASADDADKCFYWQDYLGDVDYVRIAVSRARQYFKAYGGNPDELKLFVNDYNLESNWDDNAKLKSLIKWCAAWENDTVKIDGLGTQMHVSYDAREGALDSQKKHIKQMFELMAATGKLVRVSELDMGYIDSKGNSVKTVDITVEQEAQMAEFYKYIVKTYFEVVPAAQRYGITHWSMTDSPEGSGWRGGDPIGLWTGTYERKPAYAGYAEGLQEGSGAAK